MLQINFFKDHSKVIYDPLLGGVTYIDEQKRPRTFNLELIEKYGCNAELASRLTYTFDKVNKKFGHLLFSPPKHFTWLQLRSEYRMP